MTTIGIPLFFILHSVKRHRQNVTTIEQHRITIYFKLLNDEKHELLLKTMVMLTVNALLIILNTFNFSEESVEYASHFYYFCKKHKHKKSI